MLRITVDPGSVSGSVVMNVCGKYSYFTFGKDDYYTISEAIYEALDNTQYKSYDAILEKVHAMPKQGVVSTAHLMENYGIMKGMLIALGIPFKEIPPQKWMKVLGIPPRAKTETKDQWKKRLIQLAKQLLPSESSNITKETADALLMNYYFDKIYNN